jgi:uncharacterized membrane protein
MGVQVTTRPATAAALPSRATQPRVEAIDLLRGLVMVLMALDHVRDFFSEARFNPTDLARTTPALFLTRWVTHFCAPVFVFLAGTGAFLHGSRGRTKPQLAWFLLSRGLWLVGLEFTLVHLGWFFNFNYHILIAQVIWAIGWSMVALAGLIFLPTWAVTTLGIAVVAGHNALDCVDPEALGSFRWLWVALCSGGIIPLAPEVVLYVAYPVLPWLGVMAAGYGFGALWLLDRDRRRRWLLGLGGALTLGFVVLRAANVYGDPNPWLLQSDAVFTFLAFLDCTKYPPSLLYVLMTLGPAVLALAWFDSSANRLGRPLVVFGRVPLFFYLLHVPLIHLAALAFARTQYGDVSFLLPHPLLIGPQGVPEGYGYGLPTVYFVTLGVVLTLYPLCRWFAEVKRRRREAWLSYF